MNVSRAIYPYPILCDFTDDYIKSFFEVKINTKMYGVDLIISLEARIINREIVNLINNHKIIIVYHLECSETGFRRVEKTFNNNLEILLNKDDVHGALNIKSFLVANEDLKNYSNRNFHEDLRGYYYDLDYGTIMGISNSFVINIIKDDLDILNRESIFSIVRNSDRKQNEIVTDLSNDKIIIKLREIDYENLASVTTVPILQDTINSILVLPVLVHVMHLINNTSVEEREVQFGIFKWYNVIRKTLLNNFNYDIERSSIDPYAILSISQKLIETPISESLLYLSRDYGTIEKREMDYED